MHTCILSHRGPYFVVSRGSFRLICKFSCVAEWTKSQERSCSGEEAMVCLFICMFVCLFIYFVICLFRC